MPEPRDESEAFRRRRARRRATAQQGPPQAARTADVSSERGTRPASGAKPTRGRENRGRNDRDVAGAGTSQVGPTGAMRARDLNRPTAEDLAEAEAGLEIVRRNWNPAEAGQQPRRRRS